MAESAPWQTPASQRLISRLMLSHQRGFKRPLLTCGDPAKDLFSSEMAVLAHDNSPDPLLIYANATALRLWERSWQEMIGMPSRCTAEEGAREQRASALQRAQQQDAFEGYSGVRVSRTGQRFMINNARIWTFRDDQGRNCGQAAAFSSWRWL
ncbi:bacterial MEKHLA protein [Synechococcus sp. BIOS-E4-1]|uniref:MEKHLA domain-containing protein n=1 Tax=Synechococcus sp. BIOS-E4-1 TaxID=1400864 RepID=UPI001645D056|nr:MEKHLA domain-containing protein [Synechococcus sp. BIOS-E4-1]QNI56712.1 bacterial MEKHLA protein [Synechococcus sp. BIOS-E4-1]